MNAKTSKKKPAAEQPTEQTPARPVAPLHPRARQIAPLLFTRYNETGPNPGTSWDGSAVPPWEKLSAQVISKWTGVGDIVARGEDNAYRYGRRQGILLVLRPLLIVLLMALTVGLSALVANLAR